jgi:hypothetical protein
MVDPMKDEYDFSTAERGKFFRQGARLLPPVHLDPMCSTISPNWPRRRVFHSMRWSIGC